MDHFGARNQGGSRRKELAVRGERGLLEKSARTVFKKRRNASGPKEGQASYVDRTEKPGNIRTVLN